MKCKVWSCMFNSIHEEDCDKGYCLYGDTISINEKQECDEFVQVEV